MNRLGFLLGDSAQVPSDNAWLTVEERKWFEGPRSSKRIADWRLGRWTAKVALANFFVRRGADRPSLIEIRAADDGAPEAYAAGEPLPVSLSLSHVDGRAFCVIGDAGVALGCDLERIDPRGEEFVESYMTRAEAEKVHAAASENRDLLVTLIWSAKESALKALRCGLRADTRSVEVTACQPPGDSWRSLEVTTESHGGVLCGSWRRLGDLVATVVTPPPRRELEDLARTGASERNLFPLTLGRTLPA